MSMAANFSRKPIWRQSLAYRRFIKEFQMVKGWSKAHVGRERSQPVMEG